MRRGEALERARPHCMVQPLCVRSSHRCGAKWGDSQRGAGGRGVMGSFFLQPILNTSCIDQFPCISVSPVAADRLMRGC